MRRRRSVSVFGMSFLDVMFCGFGSVVLLVMLINSRTVAERRETHADLRGEVARLEREVVASERVLGAVRASLESAQAEADAAAERTERASERIAHTRDELAALDAETSAREASVEALKSDLKALEARGREISAEAEHASGSGENVRRFLGDGDRQYLTGLKMGGERILILVDASASMLDETVVNVVRRRNMSETDRRAAPKWRRALAAADWLVANLPPTARFQIYAFGTDAHPALEGSAGRWLAAGERTEVEGAVAGLHALVPGGGTSLHAAFAVVAGLDPRPDNVMLVTDGLPTQGASPPLASTVGPAERLRHFESASARLPAGIPVNTILFPMEGDPLAAAAFWQLAMRTAGAFLTPSRDWP